MSRASSQSRNVRRAFGGNNHSSVAYYARRGFSIEDMIDSSFGPFMLNDYVMVKRLG